MSVGPSHSTLWAQLIGIRSTDVFKFRTIVSHHMQLIISCRHFNLTDFTGVMGLCWLCACYTIGILRNPGFWSNFAGLIFTICSWSYTTAMFILQILQELWDFCASAPAVGDLWLRVAILFCNDCYLHHPIKQERKIFSCLYLYFYVFLRNIN